MNKTHFTAYVDPKDKKWFKKKYWELFKARIVHTQSDLFSEMIRAYISVNEPSGEVDERKAV